MLIFRYLARDLLTTTLGVCSVLLLVIVSGRFVKYLAQAAAGDLDAGILLAIIGYRLPGFIELILPLAFFLGVLLSYGRLYVQSEMTVMTACGMSPFRLVVYTMIPGLAIALVVGWLSVDVSPTGLRKAEALLNAQKERGDLEGLTARHFHSLQGGKSVTYTEEVSKEGEMTDIFLAENNPEAEDGRQLVLVIAQTGNHRSTDQGSFLVLKDGYRIQGIPGEADYQITRFEEYGQRLSKPQPQRRRDKVDTMYTVELLDSDQPAYQAAVQWRLSVPVLVLVISLIAIPLSKTDPRQGRFARIVPAVLLYIIYLVTLNGARGMAEDGKVSAIVGLWGVHLMFCAIAVLLYNWRWILEHGRELLARVRSRGGEEMNDAAH
ncbi:MAG: LPS export ABC transporter permease LptF [Porticoccaceae bacterium]